MADVHCCRLEALSRLDNLLSRHEAWENATRETLDRVAAAVAAAAALHGRQQQQQQQLPARPTLTECQMLCEAAAADPVSSRWHEPLASLMAAVDLWRDKARG
jgi:hypothetical protein